MACATHRTAARPTTVMALTRPVNHSTTTATALTAAKSARSRYVVGARSVPVIKLAKDWVYATKPAMDSAMAAY